MDLWYELLDEDLMQKQGKDIFEIFRNGLVHEYFIKHNLKIGKVPSVIARDAVSKSGGKTFGIGTTDDGRLLFATRTYFRDFMVVVNAMRKRVIDKKDEKWIKAFSTVMRK